MVSSSTNTGDPDSAGQAFGSSELDRSHERTLGDNAEIVSPLNKVSPADHLQIPFRRQSNSEDDQMPEHHDESEAEQRDQEQVISEEKASSETLITSLKQLPWTPSALRHWSLYVFISTYGCLIISLVLLFALDRRNKGLATTNENLHYLWTYAPTLILSLLATFWDHVDYRTRQMMPWFLLRGASSEATATLLLDYTSQADVFVLWKALKSRHWPPFLTCASTLLIKLLIVLSTGLLALQPEVQVRRGLELPSKDRFDPVALSKSTNETVPAMFAYGIKNLGLGYPPGTSQQYAMPSIIWPDSEQEITIDATLDAFHSDLQCERGSLQIQHAGCSDSDHGCYNLPNVLIDTPSCELWNNSWPTTNYYAWPPLAGQSIVAVGFTFPCTQKTNNVTERFVIAVGLFDLRQKPPGDITAWICQSEESLVSVSAAINEDGVLVKANTLGKAKPATDLFPTGHSDLLKRFNNSIEWAWNTYTPMWTADNVTLRDAAADSGGRCNAKIDNTTYDCFVDDYFSLYLATFRPPLVKDLLNADAVLANSRWLYTTMNVQSAKNTLMSNTPETHSTTVSITELRLRIQHVAFWCMVATIVTIMTSTIILEIIVPRGVVSTDPGPIAGQAAIITRSHRLNATLSGSGPRRIPALASDLHAFTCESHMVYETSDAEFSVDVEGNNSRSPPTETSSKAEKEWYHPFSLSPWTKIGFIAILCGIIVSLEVLLDQSQKSQGIANVQQSGSSRYAWRYVPSTAMLATSIVVGMMASESKVFLPYHELRHWPSTCQRTILKNERSNFAVVTLYNALVFRHGSIVAIIVATLAAFPLTIVSSGLYTVENFNSTRAVTYKIKDVVRFPMASVADAIDPVGFNDISATGVEVSMMLNRNLTSPSWIYKDLVLPHFDMDDEEADTAANSQTSASRRSSLLVDTPAWSSSFNCVYAERSKVTKMMIYQDPGDNIDRKTMVIDFNTTSKCSLTVPLVLNFNNVTEGAPIYLASGIQQGNLKYLGPDRPYLAFVYGTMPHLNEKSSNDSFDTLDAMACCAQVNQQNVRATLEVPSMKVLDAQPISAPQAILQNPNNYPTNARVLYALNEVVNTIWPADENNPSDVASFFRAVMTQNPELSINDLLGPENNVTLSTGLSSVWSAIYPQLATRVARYPREGQNETITAANVTGTLTRLDRTRLVQNAISTHILAVLLSVIAISVGVSFWAMNTREILPENPCSIAVSMSLLAGSQMIERENIPARTEWLNNKQMREKGVFEGYLFSMGWWDDEDGGRRFGIDIGKAAWSR